MERQWRWKWAGLPWQRMEGLDYYDAVVQIDPTNRSASRTFRRGDSVCVNGDSGYAKSDLWVGQILDFIQVNDDSKLGDVEFEEETDPVQKKYSRMRCTLRWFYSENDFDKDYPKMAGLPEPANKEFYFTDDIEVPGFNAVQVIEGRAWLVDDEEERMKFMTNPDPMYAEACDSVCIVRGYISSQLGKSRKLCPGELRRLLLGTYNKPMYMESYAEVTGKPFGGTARTSVKPTSSTPRASGQSASSSAVAKSRKDPREPGDKTIESDHQPDDPDFESDESDSEESNNNESSSETKNEGKSSEAGDAGHEIDDNDTIDANERDKFRRKYTHTGRHRVRFNREERDDGSDYENDVDVRDGRYKVMPGTVNRGARSKGTPTAAKKGNQKLERRGSIEKRDKPRRRRASQGGLGTRSKLADVPTRRASVPSTKSSKHALLPNRRSKTSKTANRKTPSRPSRPGEQHLSMFRSLENAKSREAPVIIIGDLNEKPGRRELRSGPSSNRPVPNRSDEAKTLEDSDGDEDVVLSKLYPGSPSTGAGTESSAQKSVDKSADTTLIQGNEDTVKIRGAQSSSSAVIERSDSDNGEVTLSNTRHIPAPVTKSSIDTRLQSKELLSDRDSLNTARKERTKSSNANEIAKGKNDTTEIDAVKIDDVPKIPVRVGRKRVLDDDDSSDDDSADDIDVGNLAGQEELKRLFEELPTTTKMVLVENRASLVEEAVHQFDIKSNGGKLSDEALIDEIVRDLAKHLTLTDFQ